MTSVSVCGSDCRPPMGPISSRGAGWSSPIRRCATRSPTLYRAAYLEKVGGQLIAGYPSGDPRGQADVIHRVARGEHGQRSCTGDSLLRTDLSESRRRRIVLSGNPLRIHLSCRMELSAGAARPGLRNVHHDASPSPRAGDRRTARHTRVVRPGLPASRRAAAQRTRLHRPRPAAPIDEVVGINGWEGR